MKTVAISVEEVAWEAMQRQAAAQGKNVDDLVLSAVMKVAGQQNRGTPSTEERRRVLDKLWNRIDACNVEVGEPPSRARTYDDRRFHRY